jgi:hypothetical protein
MTHRIALALAAGTLPLSLTTGGFAAAAPPADGVWVGGAAHTLLVTGPAPAGSKHVTPLYVIAPVSAAHPLHPLADARLHGFGAHDHVAQFPRPGATFHGVCDLTLVAAGPKAVPGRTVRTRPTPTPAGAHPLLYAARLGTKLLPLDRVSRIRRAQHAGLARLIDTQTLLVCTISPREAG